MSSNGEWSSTFFFSKKKAILKVTIATLLVSMAFFGTFITLSIASKNVNITVRTDLDLDEFDELSLITSRKGEEYKLIVDLDEKESSFNIAKSSKIEGFEARKDIVVSDDLETTILANYTHDESIQIDQSESNIAEVNGTLSTYSSEYNYTLDSKHYMGTDSFFYDNNNQHPKKMSIDYGNALISKEYMGRDKVLALIDDSQISKQITPLTNGTIEFAVNIENYQDLEIKLFDGSNTAIKLKTQCCYNTLYYYDFCWRTTGSLASNTINNDQWTLIRIDIRCDDADSYMGISEGHYDVYINNVKVYDNKNFLCYAESLNYISLISLDDSDHVYIDSIGLTNMAEEITETTYHIGDLNVTHNLVQNYTIYEFFFEGMEAKNLKNMTISVDFITDRNLRATEWTGLKTYDYLRSTFNWREAKAFTKNRTFEKDITDIRHLNDTIYDTKDGTEMSVGFFLHNIYFNFTSLLNVSVKAYFWKEITEFSYSEMVSFEGELTIEIAVEEKYSESEIVITSIIEITLYNCFGSWIYEETSIINHTITIREEKYILDIEDKVDLADGSFFGWRELDIEILAIDLDKCEVETDLTWGNFKI